MKEIFEIADAVVRELESGSFSQTITPEKSFAPHFDLKDVSDLKIVVVAESKKEMMVSRNSILGEYKVNIGVIKKLSETGYDETEINALSDLVSEIVEFLRFRKLTDYPKATWVSVEYAPIYSLELLEQTRKFESVVTVTYRAY